ncbi:MAG: aspartate--tRNA ligase [Bacillota bacterium]|jgi:aspartyl-tRNA synthetase
MEDIYRTHLATNCNEDLLHQSVLLNGWVQQYRNLGGVIFIDLRDRSGIIQVVISEANENNNLYKKAALLRCEYVIAVKGVLVKRAPQAINPDLPTGRWEIIASDLKILNEADPSPIPIKDDLDVAESVRLQYRYLDLRRPKMQRYLKNRHKVLQITRNFLSHADFMEVETPLLTKSTPEGARDFLVPSRKQKNSFYALPQSPQLFKQLLMIGGFEQYFQISRCFRDEDLRSDRQPEFTQLDIEASFMGETNFLKLIESLVQKVFKEILEIDLITPFQRYTYQESLAIFGTDAPDLRFELPITDFTQNLATSSFVMFATNIASGGVIKGINLPKAAVWSRKKLDDINKLAKELGATKGLLWISFKSDQPSGPLVKHLSESELKKLKELAKVNEGDLLIIVSEQDAIATPLLGKLRLIFAEKLDLVKTDQFKLAWITDFPLLSYQPEENRYDSMHHPFTAPNPADVHLLYTDPLAVRAKAYDLVLNGTEIAGGSLRINKQAIQQQIFKLLGFSTADLKKQFGFFLEAFRFGTPPHLGIAFGLDRWLMYLNGCTSIRDSIAFPKTERGTCLLTDAPSNVTANQLAELGLKI